MVVNNDDNISTDAVTEFVTFRKFANLEYFLKCAVCVCY